MFVEARTRPVLDALCRVLGRSPHDAVLVRHHTNAVYAVGDLVVKIAAPGTDLVGLGRTVALTGWLCQRGFPTVGLHPAIVQPIELDGSLATVWQRLDPAAANPVTPTELGSLLSQLHTLPTPPIPLDALEPIALTEYSINASTILTDDDRRLLLHRLDALAEAWRAMRFVRSPGLIHADPQAGNALRRADGTAVLSDWDTAVIGPREWDLATIAVHCRRFAPADQGAYGRFSTAYGWDASGWASFEDLCRLRELEMIAANARKSRAGSPAAVEVHRRIAELRDVPPTPIAWHIL